MNESSNSAKLQEPNFKEIRPLVNPQVLYLRRLYFMMFLQLFIVGIVCYCTYKFHDLKNFLATHYYFFIICLVACIVLLVLGFFAREKVSNLPVNWIYYLVFTAFLSFVFAYFVAIGNSELALMAFITADVLYGALFVYALTTKETLTYYGAALFTIGSILLSLQIFLMFSKASISFLLLMTLLLGIFGFYVIYSTMTRMTEIIIDYENEDWISGAVLVYLDVFLMTVGFLEKLGELIIKERN